MEASSASPGPLNRLLDREVDLWWPLALGSSALIAYLTTQSLQVAATVALVALTLGLYAHSRTAGLATMWTLWLVLPAVRRMFELSQGFSSSDPLSLAPFIITGVISLVELGRSRLSSRAKWVLGMAFAGFVFGAPLGISSAPKAGAFALVAYVTSLLAFAVGYREDDEGTLSLTKVLTIAAAPLAVYGVLQAVAPLTSWDSNWLHEVGPSFVSIGSKEAGTLRVFSTLNSPVTLAVVLAVAIICVLCSRRFGPARSAVLVATIAGLALTLVRSAWVSLALALIVLFIAAPFRVGRRIFWVGLLTVLAFPVLAAGNHQLLRVSSRAQTVTTPGQDTSVQQRIATPQQLVPQAVRQPLGNGLGSAGEASRLSKTSSELRATDNALLSIMFQTGPVGFLLVMAAYVMGVASAVRNIRRGRSMNDIMVFGGVALLTVLLITADIFYGVSGAIVWYLLGFAVRRDDARRRLRPSTA